MLAVVATVGGACGSDDDNEPSQPSAVELTGDFCTDFLAFQDGIQPFDEGNHDAMVAELARRRTVYDAIEPPETIAPAWERYLDAERRRLELLQVGMDFEESDAEMNREFPERVEDYRSTFRLIRDFCNLDENMHPVTSTGGAATTDR